MGKKTNRKKEAFRWAKAIADSIIVVFLVIMVKGIFFNEPYPYLFGSGFSFFYAIFSFRYSKKLFLTIEENQESDLLKSLCSYIDIYLSFIFSIVIVLLEYKLGLISVLFSNFTSIKIPENWTLGLSLMILIFNSEFFD